MNFTFARPYPESYLFELFCTDLFDVNIFLVPNIIVGYVNSLMDFQECPSVTITANIDASLSATNSRINSIRD